MTQGFRFRSEKVVYGTLGAIVLAACGFGVYRYANDKECVDPTSQQVINRSHCASGGSGRWYYGGTHGGIGSKATGGSFERGGFGGHAGGGS